MDKDQKYEYYKSILVIYNTITKNSSAFSKEMLVDLESVKRKLNFIGYGHEYDLLLEKTCPLFIKFAKEIEADDVEYLINYNYDELIEEDAYDENKVLIANLIRATKQAWTGLNPKNQQIIKKRIKLCLIHSQMYNLHNLYN